LTEPTRRLVRYQDERNWLSAMRRPRADHPASQVL